LSADATFIANRARRTHEHRPPRAEAIRWHQQQPYYAPTPLVSMDDLAVRLGFERIWVKDEGSRCGTTSFKILGASWALERALEAQRAAGRGEVKTLFAATDGNHGRAVARLARLLHFGAEIFVPRGTSADRIAAIEGEGGVVRIVDGSYDDAVRRAAAAADEAGEAGLLVSDTALHVDDPTPRWTIEGNGTIFHEIDDELARRGAPAPDLVLLQIGVGCFAAAGIRHFRTRPGGAATRIVGVEPVSAACAAASIAAGRISTVDARFDSAMVGLNAQTPSLAAWDDLLYGLDGIVTITDAWCPPAREALAQAGVRPGPTGVAGVAGLLALHALRRDDPALRWLEGVKNVLTVVTESG
jgi:diaminopropionate ammonia-lyase